MGKMGQHFSDCAGRSRRRLVPHFVWIPALLLVGHLTGQSITPPSEIQPDHYALFDQVIAEIGSEGEAMYADHAAMIQVESAWNVYAESPFAQGWAQFTPPTREDWWKRIPGCENAQPFDPRCNILAMHIYNQWLLKKAIAMTAQLETAQMMQRAGYNGGMGWQMRQHKMCLSTPGCDPNNWQHLSALCMEVGRSEANCHENNSYPQKIAAVAPQFRKQKKKRGIGRKILKGVQIGVAVSQGRIPDLRD